MTYYGVDIVAELKKNSKTNVLGLLGQGVKVPDEFTDPFGGGWAFAEVCYLQSYHEIVKWLQSDLRSTVVGFRSRLLELSALKSKGDFADVEFVAAEGSSNAKTFSAHYFILFQNAPLLLVEHKLVKPFTKHYSIPMAIARPEMVRASVPESPNVFLALLEYIYTAALCEDTWKLLEKDDLIDDLRASAISYKLQPLVQACGKRKRMEHPLFFCSPESQADGLHRRFPRMLSPYIDENSNFDLIQLNNCLHSCPDRILLVEGRPIFVHSALVVAATDYFRALFNFHSDSTQVMLQDSSYDAVWHVVCFIYTNQLTSQQRSCALPACMELLEYSQEVMLPSMLPLVKRAYLDAELTRDTILDFLEHAISTNNADLEAKCLSNVGKYVIELAQQDLSRFTQIFTPDRLNAVYGRMDASSASITRRNLSLFLANV